MVFPPTRFRAGDQQILGEADREAVNQKEKQQILKLLQISIY